MKDDPLSSMIASMQLSGAVFLRANFSHPWAITAHVTAEDCQPFMPMPRQVIAYHVVTEGAAYIAVDDPCDGKIRKRVTAGDVIFLPANEEHLLASTYDKRPVSGDDLLLPEGQDGLVRIEHGGGGEKTSILCGFLGSNALPSPLMASLPTLLIVNIENLETRHWIETSVLMAARELSSGRVASQSFGLGLCRLLLTEALRNYVEESAAPRGWLLGMAHPRISQVLARIHEDLSQPLLVEDLAMHVGMSRSSFVDRFTEVMGVGPRRYILQQRMAAAALLLQDTYLTISEVAYQVGYDAPEAFSRAFKREMGATPAERRHNDNSVAA